MYRIEATKYGFKFTFSGFMPKAEMEQWVNEAKTACGAAKAPFGVLVDMRDLKPLPEDSQAVMTAAQAGVKAAGMQRSCVILSSKILTMQFERLAKESGIYAFERYIDATSTPDFEPVAVDWIANGVDRISGK